MAAALVATLGRGASRRHELEGWPHIGWRAALLLKQFGVTTWQTFCVIPMAIALEMLLRGGSKVSGVNVQLRERVGLELARASAK